jgi:glycosyltransferase involved in cell wall biosynthesis
MHRICGSFTKMGFLTTLVGRSNKTSRVLHSHNFKQKRVVCWFTSGPMMYLEFNIRLIAFLLFKDFDALYCVDLDTMMVGKVLRLFKKFTWIFDSHEWFTEVPELVQSPLKRKIWSALGHCTVPKSDIQITVNQSLANILSKEYYCPFYVLYNAPRLSPPAISVNLTKPYILYQGVVNHGRGLEAIIAAMPAIDSNLDFYIAGSGDLIAEIMKLQEVSSERHRIKILGWQDPTALKTLTQNAYLGINLLNGDSPSYYYSLANKCFDYMHAGIPAINMDFPEYQLIYQKYPIGRLLRDLNPEDLAVMINEIYLNENEYLSMQNACVEASKEYNWDVEEKNLFDIFKKS